MINRIKAKIFTQKITGNILGAPVQNIGGFDRIIFCDTLPEDPSQNTLYINKTDGTGNWYATAWHQFTLAELDPVFLAWLGANPTSGTNTGDQVGDGITITGSGTILDPFVAVGGSIDLTQYLLKDTTLQSSDTPEDTSLFSFWKIGVGRVKIAFSELITNVMHSRLGGLDWLGSGHVGTANKLFGSDENGLAKEYTPCMLITSSASSGTINLGVNTTTVLSTVLSSSHTITVTPTAPTDFTTAQLAQLDFTTDTTIPSITLTAPSGVTFKWRHTAITAWTASKTYTIQFVWISSTRCDIYYLIS